MKIMFLCRGAEYLGVEYLSSSLKAAGHETDLIFDPGFDDTLYFRAPFLKGLNRWPALVRRVKEYGPDILAVSSVSNTYPYVRRLVREITQAHPCFTVIGGIHASAIPEHTVREGLFDGICIGEGENALVELAHCLEEGEDPVSVKNFCFIREGHVIKNDLRHLVHDLDTLPFPDKDLFYRYGAFTTTLTVMTGRGCPYSCHFCFNEQLKKMYRGLGSHVRRYSPEHVIAQLAYYTARYPVKQIDFQDDIFIADKKWLEKFCQHYARLIGLPFQCNIHSHFVSDEVARLLKDAGCVNACMGVQTSHQAKRRSLLGRAETNEEIEATVAALKKHRIPVSLEYIFGLPGETVDDIAENIAFNRKLQPASTASFMLYPFPGTSLMNYCQEANILSQKNRKEVIRGAGSINYPSLISLPHQSFSEAGARIFPALTLFSKVPALPLIRLLSKRSLRWFARMIQLAFLPTTNFFQFRERFKSYLRMLCCRV